jgi:membrane fusion protein (multidrug efflux system)
VFDQAIEPSVYLVPQGALQRDFDGSAFVYLVGPGNKAMRRKVTATRAYQASWVVTAGLTPSDRIIAQGLGTLKQGMAVRPVPASSPQRVAPRPAGSGAAPRQGG